VIAVGSITQEVKHRRKCVLILSISTKRFAAECEGFRSNAVPIVKPMQGE
jgi:hypothetical protein